MLTMTNTAHVSVSRCTCLVYGEPGAGKTTLAKTLHQAGNRVLILSAESGLLSLQGTSIDVLEISNWMQFQEAYTWLSSAQQPYDWIFIDSMTEAAGRLLEVLQVEFPDRAKTLPMWGEFTKRFSMFIKGFRDLADYSVCFTALAKVDKDEVGCRYTGIDIPSKLADRVPAFFDEVFALRKFKDAEGKDFRALVTDGHDGWIAKDRSGHLAQFEAPDLASIATKMKIVKKEV